MKTMEQTLITLNVIDYVSLVELVSCIDLNYDLETEVDFILWDLC